MSMFEDRRAPVGACMLAMATLALIGCGGGGGANCGWAKALGQKKNICVEIPPKVVSEDAVALRRLSKTLPGALSTKQSMEFSCAETATDRDFCAKHCNADNIFIMQIFLVEDEADGRESWAGGHVVVMKDEKELDFSLDYALGCKDEDDYLAQDFTREDFQCGYSEIGYDLLHKTPGADPVEPREINGETYYYASMQNLIFGPDLQKSIKAVREGREKAGIFTSAYPKQFDNIVNGCIFSFKVDFVVPASYEGTSGTDPSK